LIGNPPIPTRDSIGLEDEQGKPHPFIHRSHGFLELVRILSGGWHFEDGERVQPPPRSLDDPELAKPSAEFLDLVRPATATATEVLIKQNWDRQVEAQRAQQRRDRLFMEGLCGEEAREEHNRNACHGSAFQRGWDDTCRAFFDLEGAFLSVMWTDLVRDGNDIY
jgi:hypothetical protein